MAKELKAFTNKNQKPLEKIETKRFSEFARKKNHSEFFCKGHMVDRLKNYCHQETLVHVVTIMTEELSFSRIDEMVNQKCKACELLAEFRIDRVI